MENNNINYPEGHIFVVDKPYEWTSTDVVRKIKYNLRHKGFKNIKVGHAGTLDPLATGILIVCVGKATKMQDMLMCEDKVYTATMKLGVETNSQDADGEVVAVKSTEGITEEAVRAALKHL